MSEAGVEEWRPVVGYEGIYSVSSLGRVRSEARLIVRSTGAKEPKQQRLKAIHYDKAGYARTRLTRLDKGRTVLVHHLVLAAFVGPCPKGLVGCHGDGNPRNAIVSNLRWDTMKSNSQDAIRHGTLPVGEKHWSSRLTASQVQSIRSDVRTQSAIASEYGVDQSHVSRIKSRDVWASL